MKRLPMSRAAAALLRSVLNRAGTESGRILLTDARSVDWQSLTFIGERHRFSLAVAGADAERLFEHVTSGLAEAEFHIPGQLVADICVAGEPERRDDGSIAFTIEALTVAE